MAENGNGSPPKTREELTAAIEAAELDEMKKCSAEIDVILQKYGFTIGATPFIDPQGRIRAQVSLMAR